MIIIKEMLVKMARKILKISPICSNKFVTLSSAIGWITPASSLYASVKVANLIIGIMQIPKMIITPTKPTAFFKITPHPSTVSTASPKIFPTTGIAELTTAFVVLAVIPVNTAGHSSF